MAQMQEKNKAQAQTETTEGSQTDVSADAAGDSGAPKDVRQAAIERMARLEEEHQQNNPLPIDQMPRYANVGIAGTDVDMQSSRSSPSKSTESPPFSGLPASKAPPSVGKFPSEK